MDIKFGDEVVDKNGKMLGTVGQVIRDSWTGEIKKFVVNTDVTEDELFYSPDDVGEATENRVVLKIVFSKLDSGRIPFGAIVVDRDDKFVGKVDYPITSSLTGNVEKFKVRTEEDKELFFSLEDVSESRADKVKLKMSVG